MVVVVVVLLRPATAAGSDPPARARRVQRPNHERGQLDLVAVDGLLVFTGRLGLAVDGDARTGRGDQPAMTET